MSRVAVKTSTAGSSGPVPQEGFPVHWNCVRLTAEPLDGMGNDWTRPIFLQVAPGLHPTESVAINRYTQSSYYEQINRTLRSSSPVPTEETRELILVLASALNKLPGFEGTLFRGAVLSPEVLARYVPGETIEEAGFLSTSRSKSFAAKRAATLFVIDSNGMGKDIASMSRFPREEEVLFLPHSRFKVIEVEENTVYLRAQPGESGE